MEFQETLRNLTARSDEGISSSKVVSRWVVAGCSSRPQPLRAIIDHRDGCLMASDLVPTEVSEICVNWTYEGAHPPCDTYRTLSVHGTYL